MWALYSCVRICKTNTSLYRNASDRQFCIVRVTTFYLFRPSVDLGSLNRFTGTFSDLKSLSVSCTTRKQTSRGNTCLFRSQSMQYPVSPKGARRLNTATCAGASVHCSLHVPHPWRFTADTRVLMQFGWTNWWCGRFLASTLISPARHQAPDTNAPSGAGTARSLGVRVPGAQCHPTVVTTPETLGDFSVVLAEDAVWVDWDVNTHIDGKSFEGICGTQETRAKPQSSWRWLSSGFLRRVVW
jgi:hypothetical protein